MNLFYIHVKGGREDWSGEGGEDSGHHCYSQGHTLYSFKKNGYFEAFCGSSNPYPTSRNRLKGKCHEIFCFRFFSCIIFPKPPKITVGSFRIFPKIQGDIRKWRCTTSINDARGKFATDVNDTGVNDNGTNLPPMSTLSGAICHWFQRHCRLILPPVLLVLLIA